MSRRAHPRWAPSAEDRSPWWFVLHPDRLEVRLDRSRCSPEDGSRHHAVLGVGAAVCTVGVGAVAVGVAVRVTAFPDTDDDALVAVVRPTDRVPHPRLSVLDPVVELRRTCRSGLSGEPVPEDVAADLVAAAGATGVHLRLLPPTLAAAAGRWTTRAQTAAGAHAGSAPQRVLLEATRLGWTGGPDTHRDPDAGLR